MRFCFSNLQKMLGLTLSLLLSSFVTSAWAQCFTNNNETTSILKAHESYRLFTDRRFDFAMDALQAAALIETRENLLFSPHSLYQALTLTYYNAHGETEILLRKVLGIPEGLFKGYTFDLRTAEKLDDIKYRKWQVRIGPNVSIELISIITILGAFKNTVLLSSAIFIIHINLQEIKSFVKGKRIFPSCV